MGVSTISEEEAYLYALLRDPSGIDQAEFLFEAHENEDNCFRAWPFQWVWLRCDDPLQIDQCIAEDHRVLTARGYIPIQDVEIGDLVLTHRNRWKKVLHKWDRGLQDVVKMVGQGHPGLRLTADHEILARRVIRASKPRHGHKGKLYLDSEWLSPAKWEWNDGSGTMVANWASPAAADPLPLPEQLQPAYASGIQNYVTNLFTEDWFWLMGEFISDGYCLIQDPEKGRKHTSNWCVNRSKSPRVQAALGRVDLNYCPDNNNVNPLMLPIAVNSKPMTIFLRRELGHTAGNKKIPPWVFGAPRHLRQALFDGLMFGDNYTRPNGRFEYSTGSPELAYGLRLLALSLGYGATVGKQPPREGLIRGRVVRAKLDRYNIGIEPLADFGRPRTTIIDDTAWSSVSSVTDDGIARVYDLEVEDDHSFVVEGVVVSNCARSVGKSLSIKMRGCAFAFVHPGQEMLICAPELIHLEPITNLIESQVERTWLLREMRTKPATHRPFLLEFKNGARIVGRIPQRDGKGMKGAHPLILELDEGQDFPRPGWKEVIETLKRGQEGAVWRSHGVARGVRDEFYERSKHGQDDPPLRYVSHKDENLTTVHRIVAMARPNWTDEERQEKIHQYGSREDPDFRRNVTGSHGDSQSPILVLRKLMAGTDDDPSTEYNTDEYWQFTIKDTELEHRQVDILDVLNPPLEHKKYKTTWIGADIGFTNDPTEILVFAEYPMSADEKREMKARGKSIPVDGANRLKLISRVTLRRIGAPAQADVIEELVNFYNPQAFAMDAGGNGLPLFQQIQRRMEDVDQAERSIRSRKAAEAIKGYKFDQKIVVDFDETVELDDDITMDERIKLAGIQQRVLEAATDVIRTYVDEGRIWLPWDTELLSELQGQSFSYSKSEMDRYGRRRRVFSQGNFHAFDAMRFCLIAHKQFALEALINARAPETAPVLDLAITRDMMEY